MTRKDPDPLRRGLLTGMLALGATSALAAPPTVSLRPVLRPSGAVGARALRAKGAQDLVAAAQLGGKVGFAVANARTGEMLEVMNPLLPLPPASTAKAITALYGLEALGAGYQFRTRLIAAGPVVGGRLQGDLILAGGGDPTLDTDALGAMAAALKQAGIFEVTGKLRTHGAGWPKIKSIDPGQPDHLGYSPAVSGLNLNFNRVHFEWRRASGAAGYDITMQARGERYRPAVAVARMEVADRKAPVYTYSSQGGLDRWSVAAEALGKEGARWLPVRRPERYAEETFAALARSHGIVLKLGGPLNKLPAGGAVLVEHASAPLEAILRGMLKYSTNITAECIGMAASRQMGGSAPGSLKASGGRMADWLTSRANTNKARFVDHSGLGDASRISAEEMVSGLAKLAPSADLKSLLKEIKMRDKNGRVIDNHPVSVHAKTGTLNFVSGLAGFADGPGDSSFVFAIFCADMNRRRGLSRAERERPEGGRAWVRRARSLQLALVDRWVTLYG